MSRWTTLYPPSSRECNRSVVLLCGLDRRSWHRSRTTQTFNCIGLRPPRLRRLTKNAGVVEAELAEIAQLDDAIDELQSRVGGFTPSEFRAASGRVANERRLAELLAQQSAIEENLLDARARVITRRIACMAAEEAVALVSPARAALVAVDQLVNQRSENGAKLLKKRTDMRAAETKLDGASGWWAKRKARRERDDAAEDLAAFEPLSQSATADVGRQIEAQMLIIGTQTMESIAELDTALDLANRQSIDASAEVALAEQRLDALTADETEIRAEGTANPADHDFLRLCVELDLPAAYVQLTTLAARQRIGDTRRSALVREHKDLVDRARGLRQDAEQVLIDEAKMVATTLARSRVHRVVAKSSFDVVLIDEAGAASLVEVMLALCRATTTAVLFGDFLQLAPVQDKTIRYSRNQQLRRWVASDPFTHAQIRTPKEAIENPGCVALLHQFRFGPTLRQLANDVIYKVLQDAAELPGVTHRQESEIVSLGHLGPWRAREYSTPGGQARVVAGGGRVVSGADRASPC